MKLYYSLHTNRFDLTWIWDQNKFKNMRPYFVHNKLEYVQWLEDDCKLNLVGETETQINDRKTVTR